MATYRTSAAGGSSSGTANRTAVITPAVGDLLLVFCNVDTNTQTSPTCSDNNGSGTYTLIRAARRGTNAHVMSCFVRDALMVNTTSTTVTVATGSNTSGSVVIIAVSGMERTGSTAIRQSAMQENQAAAGTPAPSFTSFSALTANLTLTAVGNASNPAGMTQPSGWTERQDVGQTSNNEGLAVCTRDNGFTGTTVTWGGTSGTAFSSVAIELDTRSTDKTLTFPSGGIESGFATGTAAAKADWPVSSAGGIASGFASGTATVAPELLIEAGGLPTGFASGTATVTVADPAATTALTGVIQHPLGWLFTPLGQSPGLPGLTRIKRVEPVLWQDFTGQILDHTVTVSGIAAPTTAATITEVGGGSQRAEIAVTGVASTTIAFPANVTQGHHLVVVGTVWATSATSVITITDTLGTSYAATAHGTWLTHSGGTATGFIAYGIAPASGACTVTIDPDTSGNSIAAGIDEFSGVGLAGLTDGFLGNDTDPVTYSGRNLAVADSLLVGTVYTSNAGGTLSLDAYNEIYTAPTAAVQQSGAAWRLAGPGTGWTIAWSVTTSQNWRTMARAFRPATSAFGTPTVTQSAAGESTISPTGIPSGFAMGVPATPAATHQTSGGDATDTTTYTTASITPTANRLLLAWVHSYKFTGIASASLTGNGLTWTEVDGITFNSSRQRLSLFRAATGSSPTAGAVTITFPSAQWGCTWSIVEFSGTETDVAAIVQNATNSGSGSSLTVTLPGVVATGNAGAAGFGIQSTTTMTPGTGWTKLGEASEGSPTGIMSAWNNTGDTTADMSWSGSGQQGGVAVEIKAGVSGHRVAYETAFQSDGAFQLAEDLGFQTQAVVAKAGTDSLTLVLTDVASSIAPTVQGSDAITVALTDAVQTILVSLHVSDSITVALTDTTATLRADMQRTDAVSVSITDAARTIASSLQRTDHVSLSLTDAARTVAVALQVTDSVAVSLTDAARTVASVLQASDSVSVALTDASRTMAVALQRTDVLSLMLSDAVATLTVALARPDQGSLSLSESASLAVVLQAVDSLSLALDEASDIFIPPPPGHSVSASDSVSLSLTESVAAFRIAMQRADQVALALAETASLLGTLSRTDEVSIGITDAAALLAALVRQDTAQVALTDAARTVLIASRPSDALSISLTEARTLSASSTRADSVAIGLTEAAAIYSAFTRTDALSIALQDLGAIFGGAAIHVSDSLSVQALDAVASLSVAIRTPDSIGAIDDRVASLLVSFEPRADSLSVALQEARALLVLLPPVADALGVRVTDAVAVLANVLRRADTANIAIVDQVAQALVSLARTDVTTVALQEARQIGVAIYVAESLAISLQDAARLTVALPRVADTLGVALDEAAAIFVAGVVTLTASDAITVSLDEVANLLFIRALSASDVCTLSLDELVEVVRVVVHAPLSLTAVLDVLDSAIETLEVPLRDMEELDVLQPVGDTWVGQP